MSYLKQYPEGFRPIYKFQALKLLCLSVRMFVYMSVYMCTYVHNEYESLLAERGPIGPRSTCIIKFLFLNLQINIEAPVYSNLISSFEYIETCNRSILNYGWVEFPMAYTQVEIQYTQVQIKYTYVEIKYTQVEMNKEIIIADENYILIVEYLYNPQGISKYTYITLMKK